MDVGDTNKPLQNMYENMSQFLFKTSSKQSFIATDR